MAKQDDYVRYTIRVPKDVYAAIEKAAEEANRSANAEIVERIKAALEEEHGPSKGELAALINQQSDYIESQKDVIAQLKSAIEMQKHTIETQLSALERANATHKKLSEMTESVLWHVLGYAEEIPAPLTVWVDQMLKIFDLDSALDDDAEDALTYPGNVADVQERVESAKARYAQHMDEQVKAVLARRGIDAGFLKSDDK